MSHIAKLLHGFGRLLYYPGQHTLQTSELLYVVLLEELPEAASEISAFGAFAEQHEDWELEEAFTRTFDVNPTCALEVGWHLFGEEYARGMFLVRMREELRKLGLPEGGELPDHVSHVLAVLAEMTDDEAARFVRACVQPAIEKMNAALLDSESPYRHVIAALAATLAHVWGEFSESEDETQAGKRPVFESDPLRDYPVADVGCGCDSPCSGSADLVPLELGRPAETAATPNDLDAGAGKP